jgi:1-acyl-sn-glycerol-3-phosphate acyltransferase
MLRRALHIAWALYVGLLFVTLLTLAVLCAILLPTVKLRRDGSRSLAKILFPLAGLPYSVRGAGRLPETQSVVVANHASYVDGPLLYAALPSRFGFVIKKEVGGIPLAGWLLDRLGHELVDRHN